MRYMHAVHKRESARAYARVRACVSVHVFQSTCECVHACGWAEGRLLLESKPCVKALGGQIRAEHMQPDLPMPIDAAEFSGWARSRRRHGPSACADRNFGLSLRESRILDRSRAT